MIDPAAIETAKTLSDVVRPLTEAVVALWLKPKLQKFLKKRSTDGKLLEYSFSEKFQEYLERSYDKHSYLTTIVFQNQKRKLLDLYVPLAVKSLDGRNVVIDGYKDEFLPQERKVLLTDTAGMGKSTILKFLFLSCIQKNSGLPIFVELRKLRRGNTVLDVIYNDLNPLGDASFDRDFVLALLNRGDFVLFLDGYDEIPFDEREVVHHDLDSFRSKARKNLFIIASRPEYSLASFPDFRQFRVQPMTANQAFGLIHRYDIDGTVSEELIQKLKRPDLKPVHEFLTNPLLVSLLLKSYQFKPVIPFKKHIFYRQVYDSLFETHDLTKEGGFERRKQSLLDIEDFHRALRVLGILTVKRGQVEFEKDKLLALVSEVKTKCPGLTFKEGAFLNDLTSAVPLFVKEGEYYRWAHKSIQEYFAAQFICLDAKDKQDGILKAIANSGDNAKYTNLIDLCYDIDYKTFRRAVIYDLLVEFEQYCLTSYAHVDKTSIKDEDVRFRKACTFAFGYALVPTFSAEKALGGPQFEELWTRAQVAFSESTPGEHVRVRMMYAGDNPLFVGYRRWSPIIEVLASKGDAIFTSTLARRALRGGRSGNAASPPRVRFKVKSITVVTDHPDSPLNTPRAFRRVNAVLGQHSLQFGSRVLDQQKCVALRKEIENEVKLAQASDDLMAGF